MRLNDEISVLRDKLNKSVLDNDNYEVVYSLSVELDELIALYYRQTEKKYAN